MQHNFIESLYTSTTEICRTVLVTGTALSTELSILATSAFATVGRYVRRHVAGVSDSVYCSANFNREFLASDALKDRGLALSKDLPRNSTM